LNILSEYFYKYLLSRPSSDIDEALLLGENMGLQSVSLRVLRNYRNELGPFPNGYSPGEAHMPTIRWLLERKIKSIWYPDKYVREALSLLDDSKRRDLVEACILMPTSNKTVIEELPFVVSEEAISIYQHYFFNVSSCNADELYHAISHNPRHRMMCDVHPSDDVALSVMKHIYGLSPSEVSAGRVAKLIIGATSAKLLAASRSENSNDDALKTSRYIGVIQKGQEIIAGGGLAAEELIDVLNQISIDRTEQHTQTYKELTGKEYIPDEEDER
jgi:hypothetical protein